MKNQNYVRAERNIGYFEGNQFPYYLQIFRGDQSVGESYATIEEAIIARDEIESNYRETNKLEHSSIYEPARLRSARLRYQRDDLKKTDVYHYCNPTYSVDATCIQCGQKQTYRFSNLYRRFLDRGERCQACCVKNRHNDLMSARNASDKPNSTNQSTGIKNIIFDNRNSRYRVMILRKGRNFSKTANTLEAAIKIKEHALDFYEKFDRLPNVDEI